VSVVPTRILLVSTYELGHQPLHLASPAAALLRAGHEVRCRDLAVETLDHADLSWADAVAFSVPMHTAMRLALPVARAIHAARPEVHLAFYGLYATLPLPDDLPVDLAVAGEYEPELVAWASQYRQHARLPDIDAAGGGHRHQVVSLRRTRYEVPARHLLPSLEHYARFTEHGEVHLAAAVEASHGCNHRCRHCPVPVVYDGRTRLVGLDALLGDVEQLVAMGASHLSFADPDFLSGPQYARRVVDALHRAFPALTFDVTVKVEHILAQRELWPTFAAAGCRFVVSAFESASDTVLGVLHKGHRVADAIEATRVLRRAGIEPRPSLLPFTPWTTPGDVVDLLDLVAACDLVGNVDPVHYAIRLLVPPGSLLLRSGALQGRVGAYDPEQLGYRWVADDPRLDRLQLELAALAEELASATVGAVDAYQAVRAACTSALDPARAPAPAVLPGLAAPMAPDDRPRLTESWFCCAEPTTAQRSAVAPPAAGPTAAPGDAVSSATVPCATVPCAAAPGDPRPPVSVPLTPVPTAPAPCVPVPQRASGGR